jgi:hypothetical protein
LATREHRPRESERTDYSSRAVSSWIIWRHGSNSKNAWKGGDKRKLGEVWPGIERGWCLGSEEFNQQMLEKMNGSFQEHYSGELRGERAAVKAECMIAEELQRTGWIQTDLALRLKGASVKMTVADWHRRERILSVNRIARRLSMERRKARAHGSENGIGKRERNGVRQYFSLTAMPQCLRSHSVERPLSRDSLFVEAF